MGQSHRLCKNCCYWQRTVAEDIQEGTLQETLGICRLIPPAVLESGTRWPMTKESDWCGEFDHLGPDAANEF